jgi:hypothetical protein
MKSRRMSTVKRILRASCFTLLGLFSLILLCLFLYFVFNHFFNERKVIRRDPLTGLQYKIPLKYTRNNDFRLIVEKKRREEIPPQPLSYDDRDERLETERLSWYDVSGEQPIGNGLSYVHVMREWCFKKHIESLDPKANEGKELGSCTDTWGSVLDTYYVFVGDDTYAFTTDFPTRLIYHDPNFGSLPARISAKDFKSLIESLEK